MVMATLRILELLLNLSVHMLECWVCEGRPRLVMSPHLAVPGQICTAERRQVLFLQRLTLCLKCLCRRSHNGSDG
jgi:hypothetical protein